MMNRKAEILVVMALMGLVALVFVFAVPDGTMAADGPQPLAGEPEAAPDDISATGPVTFTFRKIRNQENAQSAAPGDFDGDGDLDVVVGSYYRSNIVPVPYKLYWARRVNSTTFEYGGRIDDSKNDAAVVRTGDLEGDGHDDVLHGNRINDRVGVWRYEEDDAFHKRSSWVTEYPNSIGTADVNGDGRLDVLVGGGAVYWIENDGGDLGSFPVHEIVSPTARATSIFGTDFDGDMDVDIVFAACNTGGGRFWLENDGNQNFALHEISPGSGTSFFAHPADMDGDGDVDVVGFIDYDDQVAWFENDGAQSFTPHVISDSFSLNDDSYANAYGADMDGDGDMDVLASSQKEKKLVWWENDGQMGFTEWWLEDRYGWYMVMPHDLDGDRDLDILTAGYGMAAWYQQEGSHHFVFLPIVLRE